MDNDNILLLCSATTLISIIAINVALIKLGKKRRKRKIWSKQWLRRREQGKGVLNMLNKELLLEDSTSYRNFLRLTSDQFEYLLTLINPKISKQDTVMRQCIPPRSKLETTLRFLATGETFRSLMYSTRIAESTISRFIPEVCQAIVRKLKPIFLKTPSTPEEWHQIANEFSSRWQFPHCIGALDGRHITFRPPISQGSYFYNYKGTHSIVLLGLADATYKFIYVNIGVNGRVSDGGVFGQSKLSKAIYNNSLNLPQPAPLPGQEGNIPYVIVADDAFPLLTNLMKPYPDRGLSHDSRIFNYRLSRARRIVENAFGILANRFRILLNPINLCPEKVELLTLTCVLLHNFLATENVAAYTEIEEEMQHLPRITRQCGNRTSSIARDIRDGFRKFFNSPEGKVEWQERSIQAFNY